MPNLTVYSTLIDILRKQQDFLKGEDASSYLDLEQERMIALQALPSPPAEEALPLLEVAFQLTGENIKLCEALQNRIGRQLAKTEASQRAAKMYWPEFTQGPDQWA